MMTLEQYLKKIPDFKGANWLLRVPLGVIFILQGLQKLPLDVSDAEAFGLPMSVSVLRLHLNLALVICSLDFQV